MGIGVEICDPYIQSGGRKPGRKLPLEKTSSPIYPDYESCQRLEGGRKVGVGAALHLVVPVAVHVVLDDIRRVAGARDLEGPGRGHGEAVLAARIDIALAEVVCPLGASSALHGHLPMGRVGLGAGLEDLDIGAGIGTGGEMTTEGESAPCSGSYIGACASTYLAHRDETTMVLPAFQATARGFRVMLPPKPMPAQPMSFGHTNWTTMS